MLLVIVGDEPQVSLPSSNSTSFWTGRSRNLQDLVRHPLLSSVWSATASLSVHTWPSAFWWASITRESCHWLRGRSSLFLIRTTSPTHLFHQGLLHFCLCCRLIRYSFLHLIQNSLAKCCTHDHPQLLHNSSCRMVLPSNRSGATKLSGSKMELTVDDIPCWVHGLPLREIMNLNTSDSLHH